MSVCGKQLYMVLFGIEDGKKYLLVPADENVEVNGFGVRVSAE